MEFLSRENATDIPTIHVISDSIGITAQTIARSAASQFGVQEPNIELFTNARSAEQIEEFLIEHSALHMKEYGDPRMIVFYTLVAGETRSRLEVFLEEHPEIIAVDLMTRPIDAIAQLSGKEPQDSPGEVHVTDERYFKRIEAIEFTIAHDDGRNPQDLPKADIVLLGVSRSSKTPTSIYLAQEGLRVSNVPLDLHTDPPKEIYEVDATRLFGLMTTPEVLVGIRQRRLGNAIAVASDYANPESVAEDLEKARALMRKLGCIVVRTDKRAVEETAQEILRYYGMAHPRTGTPGRV